MSDSKHQLTCVFEDGTSRTFQAAPFETIYQAALRSGLTLQTDCREGACGTCKALCSDGQVAIGDVSDEALSDEEARDGYVLTCQAKAKSALLLEFPYPFEMSGKPAQRVQAEVASHEAVAEGVVRLELAVSQALSFLPGQYVKLTVPDRVPGRSFSFANAPSDGGTRLEFYVRLLPSGAMSDYLREHVQVGDAVEIDGPYGQFFLRPPQKRRVLMVAGGTGLAPMLSMLAVLTEQQAAPPEVQLLYGANQTSELFGRERIAALGDWVTLRCAVVEPDASWTGQVGHVTTLIDEQAVEQPDNTDVYLCGPPPMIDTARERLLALGVPPRRIYAERFLPS